MSRVISKCVTNGYRCIPKEVAHYAERLDSAFRTLSLSRKAGIAGGILEHVLHALIMGRCGACREP